MINDVIAVLRRHRFNFSSESELQEAIARALDDSKIWHQREVVISSRDRLDFLFSDGLAAEVKIDGALAALTRQLIRYAGHPKVSSLLVITSKAQLTALPSEFLGKPVTTFLIMRGF